MLTKRHIILEGELFNLARECIMEKRAEVAARLYKYKTRNEKDWADHVLKVYDDCICAFDSSAEE